MILFHALFIGFFLNLVFQLGFSLQDAPDAAKKGATLPHWLFLFLTLVIFWGFFSTILNPLSLGFFAYFLLFPFSVLVNYGLGMLFSRLLPKQFAGVTLDLEALASDSAYHGLVMLGFLVIQRMASSFFEASTLALGFALGGMASVSTLAALRRRSALEKVPALLAGVPLTLVATGLLALVVCSVALAFFTGTR